MHSEHIGTWNWDSQDTGWQSWTLIFARSDKMDTLRPAVAKENTDLIHWESDISSFVSTIKSQIEGRLHNYTHVHVQFVHNKGREGNMLVNVEVIRGRGGGGM